MAAAGSLLYGNFGAGAGIWEWDSTTWSQITPNNPNIDEEMNAENAIWVIKSMDIACELHN
jgi:hypothetical protein